MKDLFIYHPGTGTMISLSDPVYLIDTAICSDEMMDEFSNGSATREYAANRGYRLDNYNMTNLFFGGNE